MAVALAACGGSDDEQRAECFSTPPEEGGDASSLRTDVVIESSPSCETDWTAYPGGVVFSGRQCVRLAVEGPGGEQSSAILALRRDC